MSSPDACAQAEVMVVQRVYCIPDEYVFANRGGRPGIGLGEGYRKPWMKSTDRTHTWGTLHHLDEP